MELVAPAGKVYQAGTLSGNPVAMAAGLTQLKYLYDHQEIYTELEKKGELLYGGMGKIVKEKGLNYQMNHVGSLGSLFFTGQPVVDYVSAKSSDTVAAAGYHPVEIHAVDEFRSQCGGSFQRKNNGRGGRHCNHHSKYGNEGSNLHGDGDGQRGM